MNSVNHVNYIIEVTQLYPVHSKRYFGPFTFKVFAEEVANNLITEYASKDVEYTVIIRKHTRKEYYQVNIPKEISCLTEEEDGTIVIKENFNVTKIDENTYSDIMIYFSKKKRSE